MKIGIITATYTPIPAVLGGATETMMTHLINVNDTLNENHFTIFEYYNSDALKASKSYKNTDFVFFHERKIDKLNLLLYRFLRKISCHKIYLRFPYLIYCANYIRKNNFDAIIIEGNWHHALHLRNLISNKIILHMHVDRLNTDLRESPSIIASVDGIFAISQFCKNKMLEVKNSDTHKIYVVKNTIDTNKFIPKLNGSQNPNFFGEKYGLQPKDKIVCFCGRLVENKGILHLIKAMKYVNKSNVKLLVLGSSRYKNSKTTPFMRLLQNEAQSLGNRVVFAGYISQDLLPYYIQSCFISVVPSICNEAAGNVILESLSCGIPVITTTQGGIPEYADNSACDLIEYNNDFVYKLSKSIMKFVDDVDYYESKRKCARQVALKYDKHLYYQNFCSCIQDIISK